MKQLRLILTCLILGSAATLAQAAALDPDSKIAQDIAKAKTIFRVNCENGPCECRDNMGTGQKGYNLPPMKDRRIDVEALLPILASGKGACLYLRGLALGDKEKGLLAGVVLAGANLSDVDLSGANFDNALLPGANLSGANLSKAHIEGANLQWANLSGANLSEALGRASMDYANLKGANLNSAYLSRGTSMISADLSSATMTGADLSGAQMFQANLAGVDLRKVDLANAQLREAMYDDKTKLGKLDPKALGMKHLGVNKASADNGLPPAAGTYDEKARAWR